MLFTLWIVFLDFWADMINSQNLLEFRMHLASPESLNEIGERFDEELVLFVQVEDGDVAPSVNVTVVTTVVRRGLLGQHPLLGTIQGAQDVVGAGAAVNLQDKMESCSKHIFLFGLPVPPQPN